MNDVYKNLSLGSASSRFVGDLINDISQLITVAVIASIPASAFGPPAELAPTHGGITSGVFDPSPAQFATIKNSLDTTHNSFKIGFNGNSPVNTVKVDDSVIDAETLSAYLTEVATRITQAVQAINPNVPAWKDFTCTADDTHLILTSGTSGGSSAVKVADADTNSVFTNLHLDIATVNAPNIPSLSGAVIRSARTTG